MRAWEFEDNRVAPSSVVLEQDFILKLRRLHRVDTPFLVLNVLVSDIPSDYAGRGALEEVHHRIQAMAQAQRGSYAEMSNGDVFLIWPITTISHLYPDQILTAVLPKGTHREDKERFLRIYNLPGDYTLIRERANHYIDASRAAPLDTEESAPAKLLQSDAARGPLTAWSLMQIEDLFKNIELYTFIRSQAVYQMQPGKGWAPVYDETFMGLGEIKQIYFPHCDVNEPKNLFLDLCQLLDKSLLTTLAENSESVSNMRLGLNLSLHTILGSAFSQFTHHFPRPIRRNICFEIHSGDLMQDFSLTLNALETLRQEDFLIALDGISPDMVGYIHFPRFNVNYIKINVSKGHLDTLKRPDVRHTIAELPRDKVVFFNCDSERALKEGQELGITRFQGWLIDDQARAGRKG